MTKFKIILRILLGAVFCASAISKLFSMESFELYIFSYGLFNFDLCSLAARVLPACELILGMGLVCGFWRKTVNWLTAAVLAGFSLLLVWRIAIGDQESCHCFGDLVDLNPAQSLIKNAVMGIVLALAWKSPERDFAEIVCKKRTSLLRLITAAIIVVVSFSTVFAACPPSFYFRMLKSTQNLSEEQWSQYSSMYGYSAGRHAVLLVSPICEHCQHCAQKVGTILDRHPELPTDRIHVVFMTVTDNLSDMDTLIPYFYQQASVADFSERGIDRHIISYEDFIPMTDGMMPLVCLFEDGTLVHEYTYSTLDETAFVDFLKE